MSNVTDRGVIDITLEEDNKYVLIIIDTLEWKFSNRENHGRILQDKINDYKAIYVILSGNMKVMKFLMMALAMTMFLNRKKFIQD